MNELLTKDEFIKKYNIKLNEQQLSAMESTDGFILVLAVPGSGKTTTLCTRLGYMIKVKGINPNNILVLTYTVAATKNMANRYCSMFGDDEGCDIEFRTINGICSKIIYTASRRYGKEPYNLLSDEKKKARLIGSIYQELKQEFATENIISNITTWITYAKNMMLTEEEMKAESTDKDPYYDIYVRYNKYLRDNYLIDYDDQMIFAYKLLTSDKELLAQYQNKYQYICVDEAQDTSKIQHKIVEVLSKSNLFMVGDEDQSIYNFRAAFSEGLVEFENTYPNAKVLLMEENFRSDKNIVDNAKDFISNNLFRHEKNMFTQKTANENLACINIKARKEQYMPTISLLKEAEGSVAVLYRDNEDIIPIVDILDRNNEEFNMKNSDCVFFTNKVVVDVINFMKLILNPNDMEAFEQVYYKMSLYLTKADVQNAINYAKRNNISVFEALRTNSYLAAHKKKACESTYEDLKKAKKQDPISALRFIRFVLDYNSYMDRNGLDEKKFDILNAIAEKVKTIPEFLNRLNELYNIFKNKINSSQTSNVTFSTIHSSKGLEYDTVILIDVINGIFPLYSYDEVDTSDLKAVKEHQEERRLFYVGVTRARKKLYLFDMKRHSDFVEEFLKLKKIPKMKLDETPKKKTKGDLTKNTIIKTAATSKSNSYSSKLQNTIKMPPVKKNGQPKLAQRLNFKNDYPVGSVYIHPSLGASKVVAYYNNNQLVILSIGGKQKTFSVEKLIDL